MSSLTCLQEQDPIVASILDEVEDQYQSINWSGLEKAGFEKRADYCFIFSYPPVRVLKPIPSQDLFRPSPWEKPTGALNMYIHIPFCTGICSYCYFAKVIDSPRVSVGKDEYIDLLIWEISDKLERMGGNPEIKTVHFGGGTPSTLEPDQIRKIMAFLRTLNLSPGVEITFECAPETIWNNSDKLRVLYDNGVNRVNIGVESLDDRVLKMMGRRHHASMTEQSVENARLAGFQNVNADLIYGLPHENIQSWIETLRRCVSWKLESISVYRLRKHPKKQISRLERQVFPTYEDTMRMQLAHKVTLGRAGYRRVQSHKYASGADKIQQQTEKKRGVSQTQLLSAGCGAYGFMNATFYWNTKSLAEYGRMVRAKQHPTWIGQTLEKDDLMRKSFVLGVHTSKGINLKEFHAKFHAQAQDIFPDEIKECLDHGLFRQVDGHLQPTELGYFFGDEISTKFYSPAIRSELRQLGMRYGMFFENDRYA